MSDLYRSRAPRSSSRRQQQTALPAEITTPVAQAFSSEYQAAAEVNAQAEEQDLIKQQQEAEQERQQINRQSVATAKRVGQQTQMDPLTGAESVKKDTTTGKPVWEAGFIGDPTPDNTGKPVVPFRDPTGRTAQVPLEAINRKVEPTGETFYEFDMTGEDGQAQRVRRPEDKSNPLFKIDEATGQRYRDVADATGSMVRQPLGIDPVAANQARINKRKEAYAKEKEALKFQEDTLQLEMQGEELNLKPLKEKLTEAEKLAKQYAPEAAKDKSRYEQRPDGLYRVDGSFGDLPAIPRKIETPDEIAAANNWLKQKEQADKQFHGLKAEHDPVELRVRDLEKRRNALAKQALAASKRAQTDMADMEIAAKAGMDLSRPQWKQVLDIAKKDDRFQQIIAAGEAADQGSLLADAIAGAVARHNKSVTDQSVLEDAARAFDYLNAKAPKTMAEESAAAQVQAEQATKTALVDMLASGVRGDKGTDTVAPQRIFPTKHPKATDGRDSNVLLVGVNLGGKETVIPTMIDGKEVSIEEAVAVARKNGIENYPSFATEKEATAWARQNHGNIDENGFLRDPATTNRAREIATKSLGVQDPENWSLSPDNRGNYNLHHTSDEAPLGWLDTKNKRVMLFPSATVTDAGQQLLEKASADGFPVFHMGSEATGGGVPMTHQELRDYVAKGVEIARSAATPDEKEALLAKEGITPTDIREQVMAGRMSVQDGRWLNEKLFEEKELDNSPDGYAKGFAEYLAANPTQANIMATGNREQKLAVANNYSDARAGQSSAGNLFFQRDTMADRRVELAQKVAPTGKVEKLTTGAKQILAPMVGLLAQMPAWAFQEALKRAGSETEAGRLADEQFGDWQKRTSGFFHRINARDDVTESLTEFKQWANRARPGDQPPDELANKVAKSVFDGYHQLTEESARDLNTSLDTFNVNKDPKLQALLQRYLTTSDPSAFEQMASMMVMDAKDRKTQAEVMKYIERPRAATPELVADRAKELGLNIQPGAAPRLLEMATALGNSKDDKQSRSILTQVGKMLGTTTDSDTLHALHTITTEATDDPDSFWGLTKGGFVAGRQEAVTELGSTLAEGGLAMLTGGAATPEILAGKAARRTMLSAGRAALKRTATAALDALADESKLFAVTRAGINRGRAKLGSVIAKDAEAFAKEGIITPDFGVPLTAGQKLKNAAVTVGKTAAAAAPIEATEEGVAAIGDVDPTIQGTVEQMGMGAIGAGLITPIFLGAATVRNVYQARKAEKMLGQAKAQWVEKFNERHAKVPGFKPITVAQYDVWSGTQDNPAHKQGEVEYQSALAEKLAAYKEAESTPVAGPATAAPPAPQTTPGATPDATSQKGQGQGQEVLTPAPEATPVAEAQPAPATTPEAALSPEENARYLELIDRRVKGTATPAELKELSPLERRNNSAVNTDVNAAQAEAQTEKFNETPNVETPQEEEPVMPPDPEDTSNIDQPFAAPATRPLTPRQIAADARLEAAIQNLAGLSQIAFSASEEIFALPEADRPLYTAVAKAKAGSTIYTADEAKALIKQNGANAVTFQKAEILPPDVQGPRNLKTLADLPKAIQVGPALYRLPEGVQIAIPDALTASVVANAPSLGILLQTSAQAQAAAKPTVSPEYLAQWEQFGAVKSEGGAVAVTSDTRKAHEAAMFALKQAGIRPNKVVTGPGADGKTAYTILFDAPESAQAKPQTKPQQFTIAPAKDIIQQVAKANPKIVALLRPTPNANTSRANGGMWIAKDENSIEIHFETLDTQLATLKAQGRIKSAEQAAEHVQAVLDEEIRHIANIEASRRLHKKIAPDEDYTTWREAYYGKMWREEFNEDQRKAVMDAYGDTLKGASDYIKALEGLRMVSQVGSKWGKITEAVLFHLEQVLKVLRELVAKPSKAIQNEIENIKAVLAEYGYDTEQVSNDTTAEETPEITITVKKDGENEIRALAFADPQDAAVFDIADKYDSLNRQQKPENRKKVVAEINAFADALAAKLTADGTATTRQKLLGTDKNGGRGTIRAYADRVRTQAIEGNTLDPFTPQTFDSYIKHGNLKVAPSDSNLTEIAKDKLIDPTGLDIISQLKELGRLAYDPNAPRTGEWEWYYALQDNAKGTKLSLKEIASRAAQGNVEDPAALLAWVNRNVLSQNPGTGLSPDDAADQLSSGELGQTTPVTATELGPKILEAITQRQNAMGKPATLDDKQAAEGDAVAAQELADMEAESLRTGKTVQEIIAERDAAAAAAMNEDVEKPAKQQESRYTAPQSSRKPETRESLNAVKTEGSEAPLNPRVANFDSMFDTLDADPLVAVQKNLPGITTPPTNAADKALVERASVLAGKKGGPAGVIPPFQGNKRDMILHALPAILRYWTAEQRGQITELWDMFAGGGAWGLLVANQLFPNVKVIHVNEFDPIRAAKVRWQIEKGDTFEKSILDPRTQMALQTWLDEHYSQSEGNSWSSIRNSLRAMLEARQDAVTPEALGALVMILDDPSLSTPWESDDSKASVAEVTKWALSRHAVSARQIYKTAQQMRDRGVEFKFYNDDAYELPVTPGPGTFVLADPPYIFTLGYKGDDIVGNEIYTRTADLMERLVAQENHIAYTDEAWWIKPTLSDVVSDGAMADAAKTTARIANTIDLTVVADLIGNRRYETLGLHNSLGSKLASNRPSDRTQPDSQNADGRPISGGQQSDGRDSEGAVAEGTLDQAGIQPAADGEVEDTPFSSPATLRKLSEQETSELSDEYLEEAELVDAIKKRDPLAPYRLIRYWNSHGFAEIASNDTPAITNAFIDAVMHMPVSSLKQDIFRYQGYQTPEERDAYLASYKPGSTIEIKRPVNAFSNWPTMGKELAESYGGNHMVEFKISNPKAVRDFNDIFASTSAGTEVLYPRGSQFTVKSISKVANPTNWNGKPSKGSITTVELEEASIPRIAEAVFSSPAQLRAEILESQKGYISPKFKGSKAWLTPDGRWINVVEHYELAPPNFWETNKGFDRDLTGEAKAAGFARVVYDRNSGQLISEHDTLTPAQRSELKNTATELFADLVYDRGGLFSAPAIPLVEPGFYSQLQKVITEKMPNKADAKTIRGIITNPQTGIKADELKWTGVLNWLDEQTGTITKEQIGKYLADEGAVRFKEVRLGNPTGIEQGNVDEDFQSGEDEAKTLGLEYRWGASWGKISNSIDAELALREENIPQGLHEVLRKYHPKFKQGVLAPSKYSQYQTPGGTNYREVVLTMPNADEAKLADLEWQFETASTSGIPTREWERINDQIDNPNATDPTAIRVNQLRAELAPQIQKLRVKLGRNPSYTSSHFSDVPNYVAHSRLNDRTDADGKPGTFIEELQSDRHQQARKKGYKEPATEAELDALLIKEDLTDADKERIRTLKANLRGDTVPDAPFRQSEQWGMHLFKRALKQAVDAGHAWIGWTSGATQADRYDLSKQVKEITANQTENGYTLGADSNVIASGLSADKLADYVGKDVANKIINEEGEPLQPGNRWWRDATKPQSIGELGANVFGAQTAALMPLDVVDGGVLAASNHNQIRQFIISLLPVDVVNHLRSQQLSPNDIFSNEDVIAKNLPVDSRDAVTRGIFDAIRSAGATIRTKLESLGPTERDGLLLPTLRASDLNSREIAGLLSPESVFHRNADVGKQSATSTRLGAESPRGDNRKKLPAAKLAAFLNFHASIETRDEGIVKQFLPPTGVRLVGDDLKVESVGMKGFYDQIMPKAVGKYVKQWGSKVEEGALVGDSNKAVMPVFEPITDEELEAFSGAEEFTDGTRPWIARTTMNVNGNAEPMTAIIDANGIQFIDNDAENVWMIDGNDLTKRWKKDGESAKASFLERMNPEWGGWGNKRIVNQISGDDAIIKPSTEPSKTAIWRVDITPQMKESVERGQALFSAPARGYESMTFDPPFKTSFGDIVSYDWMSKPVGGMTSQQVSDWNQARTNPVTGRPIVHHFRVRGPDGMATVSLETALGRLSPPDRSKLSGMIRTEQRRRQEEAAGQLTLFSSPSLQLDANDGFREKINNWIKDHPKGWNELGKLAETLNARLGNDFFDHDTYDSDSMGLRTPFGRVLITNVASHTDGDYASWLVPYGDGSGRWLVQYSDERQKVVPSLEAALMQIKRTDADAPPITRESAAQTGTLLPDGAVLSDGPGMVQMPLFAAPVRAYHGTPHKVDEFKLDKIGTGEGVQAYGWGLYFAEDEEIAAHYADKLSTQARYIYDGVEVPPYDQITPENMLTRDPRELLGAAVKWGAGFQFTQSADERAESMIRWGRSHNGRKPLPLEVEDRLEEIGRSFDPGKLKAAKGNLYTVDLLGDQDEFLDWDLTLQEQSDKVKSAISNSWAANILRQYPHWTGAELYEQMVSETKGDGQPNKKVSDYMREGGIKGIRYLDGNTRNLHYDLLAAKKGVKTWKHEVEVTQNPGAKDQLRYAENHLAEVQRKYDARTSNFVLFDEKLVRIIEENGKPAEQSGLIASSPATSPWVKEQAANGSIIESDTGLWRVEDGNGVMLGYVYDDGAEVSETKNTGWRMMSYLPRGSDYDDATIGREKTLRKAIEKLRDLQSDKTPPIKQDDKFPAEFPENRGVDYQGAKTLVSATGTMPDGTRMVQLTMIDDRNSTAWIPVRLLTRNKEELFSSPAARADAQAIVANLDKVQAVRPLNAQEAADYAKAKAVVDGSAPEPVMASPATDKQADMRQALESMPPIWRDVLESSMNGQDADTIAARLNIPTEAVGNIQRVAEARLRILLDAAAGRLKPSIQPVQNNWYEPPTLKATSGRPDLALSGIPAVTAVDQRRAGPEEVTHAEMQTMANRMFALDLPATERMLKAWMESGGMTIDAEAAPDGIKDIVKAANARQAGHMLMTAAAKLMVTRYALAGTNMLETANLIDLYRNTGTEQARALNMRRDPQQSPAERAAMFIQEALLTPPQAVQNEIAKNPGNKAQILKKWVTRAERIKRELIAEGYDIDATFQQFHVEQQLADAVVPESVKPTLEQADPATQRVVRSILEGESWAEAARRAGTPIATAREAYNAFRQGVKDAYQAFKAEFLGASPADQISLLGLPEWTVDANPDAVPVQTASTKTLKQHRARRKTGGEFDLNNPLAVNRVERAVEMRKATGFDKLSEYWRASILTGPQTHVVNIVSGLTYGGYEATVKKLGAGMLADIARMFGMKPDAASLSDIPAMLAATLPAVRQAFIDSIRSFQFESRMFDSYAEGQSPTAKNSNLFKEQYQPALKGTLGTIMRGASFRLMGAADEFVKSFFTRIEVAAQARQIARTQGHKGAALANAISEQMQPGSLAWLRALEHAKKITFQQKLGSTEDTISKLDGLAKIINSTKQGQFGGLPKGIAHFVFPFVDTPTNIFKQAVTISPLGGLLAIVDATQALRRLKQGNKEQAAKLYNAARALSDITNQVVAWGAVLAIAEMVKPGDDDDKLPFLTGTIPWRAVSKGEREIAYRTAPPQSIRIGDTWYSYRRLDPFATALAFMVDSIRDLQSGKPADEILPKIGVNMLHNLQDKTFLQGISDFMNAVQDPGRFGTKWATNIATGFTPNLVRQSIRSGDDVFRESDLPNDMPFWDVLGRRIGFGVYPVGWDDGVLPRNPLAPLPATDVWGRPASKNTGTGGPTTDTLLRLFSPVDTRDTANVDPLDVRLLRWNLANPDDAFAMTAPTREIKRTINGKPVSVSLSDAEHADLTTRSGQAARQAIGNRYNDRDLTKEDVKHIRQVTDKAHDTYREIAFRKNYKPAP